MKELQVDRAMRSSNIVRMNAAPRSNSRSQAKLESKSYGQKACEALFANRPEDLIRVYLDKKLKGRFSELLKWCAKHKKAYHLVDIEELERVSGSKHHEGICILAKDPQPKSFEELCSEIEDESQIGLILLDKVGNPHNVGAIFRNAAHFGINSILAQHDSGVGLFGASARVSEGGTEVVNLVELHSAAQALQSLSKLGVQIVSTAPDAKVSLYEANFKPKTLFLFGSEGAGVSKTLTAKADLTVSIPGSGAVQSLNVASSVAVVLSEWQRRKKWGQDSFSRTAGIIDN